ncbi:MAG: dynamin family protein, partial [Burkholderiales bacterium]
MAGFAQEIEAFGAWRRALADVVRGYAGWLSEAQLSDPQSQAHLERIRQLLLGDRLQLAFVAEFSRGKSELINAIFFGGYGQRVVPSSAGRTTMCPTELLWDPQLPPSVRLLPIETRLREATLTELREQPEQWHELRIDADDVADVVAAFGRVSETRRVSVEEAIGLALYDPDDDDARLQPAPDGTLEVSRWRHAIVNLPHPLLEQGLVIVDTPGLNAIGAEPELTFNLIPAAHAVLYVLAADTGVTRSDIEVWKDHVGTGQARYAVLNKIDSLRDGMRSEAQIEREVDRQVEAVSRVLQLPRDRVFPLSAQKALLAKVRGDAELLERSRLEALERVLIDELIPERRSIVAQQVRAEFDAARGATQAMLTARR